MASAHVPERTCTGCGAKRPKADLVRIARTAVDAAVLDTGKRLPGRGAYLCPTESCWQTGIKRGINRTLRMNMSIAARQELLRAFTMGDRIKNG